MRAAMVLGVVAILIVAPGAVPVRGADYPKPIAGDCTFKDFRLTGGGSKSPLWRQIQADVFGQEVVTINAEQGPGYGVALLAAVGSGAYKTIEEACGATIRVVSRTPCNKAAAKIYDRGFPVYQRLYQSLKSDFRSIAQLSQTD